MISSPVELAQKSFQEDKWQVEILAKNPTDKIYYSINGNNNATKIKIGNPTQSHCPLMKLLKSSKTTTTEIKATLCQPILKTKQYSIIIKSKYNSQYTAGGIEGLMIKWK
jgi:hypothetical protein